VWHGSNYGLIYRGQILKFLIQFSALDIAVLPLYGPQTNVSLLSKILLKAGTAQQNKIRNLHNNKQFI
jgi:hypothetical protein